MQLYIYCIKRLARCEVKWDAQAIEDIKKVIQPLRDAYAQIAAWVGALIMNFSAYVFYIRKVTVKSEHRKFALFNKKMKGQIYNG